MYKLILELAKLNRYTLEEAKKITLNRDQLQEVAEKVCIDYREDLGDSYQATLEQVIISLTNDGLRTIGSHVVIDDGHVPWLTNRLPDIDSKHWDKYKQLLAKGLGNKVIADTDKATHEILDRLGDPLSDHFNKRGLVLGSVQMGKTLNYIGLMSKAADAGYKFIIVIAGATEVLRSQTQERVDEGFIHQPSSNTGIIQQQAVGQQPMPLTDMISDFNAMRGRETFNMEQMKVPVVVVVKKNAPVLRNLLQWITESLMLQTTDPKTGDIIRPNNNPKTDIPLLLLDDEGDYASVNTNDEDNDPTAINYTIRQILQKFNKRSYVSYTATPFANIFINSESYEDASNDQDLFPEHFIWQLGFPSNYMGPRKFFGENPQHGLVVPLKETITDNFIIDRENDYFAVTGLTNELKKAIRVFILVVVERKLRKHIDEHNSMMINCQYRTAIQDSLKTQVQEYLNHVINACKANYQIPNIAKALEDDHIKDLKDTFELEFQNKDVEVERDFEEILRHLNLAASIETLAIHSKTKDRLDYRKYPNGRNVIAIGGFSLSRGVTLMGLSVSFLDRTTQNSDTLLQMGRWFGYRDGYEDLCRLFIDSQSHQYFKETYHTLESLYDQLDFMRVNNLTPQEFGLKVRESPSALKITAKNKMRKATLGTSTWDFWGKKYQTNKILNTIEANLQNLDASRKFIRSLDEYDPTFEKNGRLWREVDGKKVHLFLQNFIEPTSPFSYEAMVRKFAVEIYDIYPRWNVWFYSNLSLSKEAKDILGDKSYSPIHIVENNFMVHPGLRKVDSMAIDNVITISNGQIGGSNIEERVLNSEEKNYFEQTIGISNQLATEENNQKVNKAAHIFAALSSPTLIIYPIIPFHEDVDEVLKTKKGEYPRFLSNPSLDVHLGFSLSFPAFMPGRKEIPKENKQKFYFNVKAEKERLAIDKLDNYLDEEF